MRQPTTSRKSSLFFPTLLAILFFQGALAQDTTWHRVAVSRDVAVYMPGQTTTYDTMNVRMVASESAGYFFQFKEIKTKYVVKAATNSSRDMTAFYRVCWGQVRSTNIQIRPPTRYSTASWENGSIPDTQRILFIRKCTLTSFWPIIIFIWYWQEPTILSLRQTLFFTATLLPCSSPAPLSGSTRVIFRCRPKVIAMASVLADPSPQVYPI